MDYPKFTFSRKRHTLILAEWYDIIAQAKPLVKAEEKHGLPTLYDLTATIMHDLGLARERITEWIKIAHEIRELVKSENLCEVLVEFDSTI